MSEQATPAESTAPITATSRPPATARPPRKKERKFSRPTMTQEVVLHTGHAQRVMGRSFIPAVESIGRCTTILYVVANESTVDEVNQVISTRLDGYIAEIKEATERVEAQLDEEGIQGGTDYTNTLKRTITFGSPAVYKLIAALTAFDRFNQLLDTAWFASLISHKEHNDRPYALRREFLAINHEIITIEKRARISAVSQGMEAAVQEALDNQVPPISIDEDERDVEEPALEAAA